MSISAICFQGHIIEIEKRHTFNTSIYRNNLYMTFRVCISLGMYAYFWVLVVIMYIYT